MSEERISIITDEISQELDVVAKFAEENDIHAFEIRRVGGNRVPDIDEAVWEDLRKRVTDDGWRILCLSPGTFKGDYRAKRLLRKQMESVFPRTIDMAKQVKAEFIITFGFMAESKVSPPDYVLGALRDAADMCADAGIPLLLENEPGSFADTAQRTLSLMNRVGHPNLFANWDPCNTNQFDAKELALGVKALSGRIRHVHVKDGKPIPDSKFAIFGPIETGELGWKEHLIELKKLGYRGFLGIETHYEPLYDSSAELLEELRDLTDEINFFD